MSMREFEDVESAAGLEFDVATTREQRTAAVAVSWIDEFALVANEDLLGTALRSDLGGALGLHSHVLEYPGPNTPNLDGLHARAKEMFRRADETYYSATNGKHLVIESGQRTVQRQADLYICWRLGQAGCNPADIPGASIHNYGLAIDVQNARDEKVIAALNGAGWQRTVMPGEPWHWEPVGTPEHSSALQRQAQMKAAGSIARNWQGEWESARSKNDKRNSMVNDFNARLQVWQPQWQQLQNDAAAFNRDVDVHNARVAELKRDMDAFNERVRRHNQEIESLRQLRARIESMPPGPARDQAIAEYNRRAQAAQVERAQIEQQRASLQARDAQLLQDKAALDRRKQELEGRYARLSTERDALLRMKGEIDQLRTEIEQHMSRQRALLEQIAREVHP